MDYEELKEYLSSLEKIGTRLGLERMERISESMGYPQNSYKIIHVAGTNGKGSVCAIISSVLRECGYVVGMFTSPYLVDVREKIMFNGQKISKKDMVKYSTIIRKENVKLTYFEFLTAIALLYFREKGADFAVVEVGLGGRLDATNVVTPVVSVITNIGLEHTEFLGKDLRSIAREKAGIIKKGVPVVTNVRGEAEEEIEKIAKERDSMLYRVKERARKLHSDLESQTVEYGCKRIRFPLLGDFQIDNLKTALETIEVLKDSDEIPDEKIIHGIGKTKWPGRVEVIGREPLTILDGAHNPDGVKELTKFIKNVDFRKMILVMGISKDKDKEGMTGKLFTLADKIILTKSSYKAMDPSEIAKNGYIIEKDPKKALEKAKELAGKDDLILVTGSLYLIGDIISSFSAI
ncbi:MAG: bifunctional folylpolyglutamate synthase/dihydrofolate synthase [Candidatus Aenigmarchaeota archaeon]|nr:bifunctional folylpolyglutamate synthase/dihydrofolate synthase [Candidatus Aenigmarchaeota archaeon]